MGTRNLTCAVLDEQFKIAQYGQFDGYPEGVGSKILKFLRDNDMNAYKEKLRKVKFISEEEEIATRTNLIGEDWSTTLPQFSRNTAEEILGLILKGVTSLRDDSEFGYDSLFCEWAYVINFDTEVFEVYKGFNEKPTSSGQWISRPCDFKKQKHEEGGYHPVKLFLSYSAYDMPTEEKFLKDVEDLLKKEELELEKATK